MRGGAPTRPPPQRRGTSAGQAQRDPWRLGEFRTPLHSAGSATSQGGGGIGAAASGHWLQGTGSSLVRSYRLDVNAPQGVERAGQAGHPLVVRPWPSCFASARTRTSLRRPPVSPHLHTLPHHSFYIAHSLCRPLRPTPHHPPAPPRPTPPQHCMTPPLWLYLPPPFSRDATYARHPPWCVMSENATPSATPSRATHPSHTKPVSTSTPVWGDTAARRTDPNASGGGTPARRPPMAASGMSHTSTAIAATAGGGRGGRRATPCRRRRRRWAGGRACRAWRARPRVPPASTRGGCSGGPTGRHGQRRRPQRRAGG